MQSEGRCGKALGLRVLPRNLEFREWLSWPEFPSGIFYPARAFLAERNPVH
jgi:hypothetical protein